MENEAPSRRISAGLRAHMSYAKFSSAKPRMLVLEGQYWLDGACIAAAERMGWEVRAVAVRMEGALPRDLVADLLAAVVNFRPDFVLSVNLSGMDVDGLFAGLFNDLEVPLVAWFVDDPRTILMGRGVYGGPYSVALTWERAYGAAIAACGLDAVHYLPLAVDATRFDAPPAETPPLPPAFVGNSMVDFAAREWGWFETQPVIAAAVEAAFAEGRVTRERFAEGVDALLGAEADALALDEEARRHVELYCFIEGTRRLRRKLAETCAPLGAVMHGDAGWAAITPCAAGPVHYFDALAGFYRDTSVNLNATSLQMQSAVNQRVFDCPAAGGFLLTDAQADLDTLFERDREVACYASWAECAALLREYAAAPALRREMTARARARVLGEHTYAHRLETLRGLLTARYA